MRKKGREGRRVGDGTGTEEEKLVGRERLRD